MVDAIHFEPSYHVGSTSWLPASRMLLPSVAARCSTTRHCCLRYNGADAFVALNVFLIHLPRHFQLTYAHPTLISSLRSLYPSLSLSSRRLHLNSQNLGLQRSQSFRLHLQRFTVSCGLQDKSRTDSSSTITLSNIVRSLITTVPIHSSDSARISSLDRLLAHSTISVGMGTIKASRTPQQASLSN